jgi:tetratricopeptide (TPR) repeat protein
MKSMIFRHLALAIVTMFLLCPVMETAAQVKGTIYKTDGGKVSGMIRYVKTGKKYEIQQEKIQMSIPEAQVMRLDIVKPTDIDAAYKQVKAKQFGAAVPVLERIVTTYQNLQWDEHAAPLLAECYLGMSQDQKAIDMVKKMLDAGGKGVTAELFGLYLDALVRQGKLAEAEQVINKVIESGARDASASAQIKRGDVLKQKGKVKEALVDGYLRTIFMFSEIRGVREEALYKAVVAFTDLGQQSNADKMRKILLAEFPAGTYSAKLKGSN